MVNFFFLFIKLIGRKCKYHLIKNGDNQNKIKVKITKTKVIFNKKLNKIHLQLWLKLNNRKILIYFFKIVIKTIFLAWHNSQNKIKL